MKILKQKDLSKLRTKWLKEKDNKCACLGIYTDNPTLDHNHNTGYCRGTIDRDVNQFIGKVESAYIRFIKYKGITLNDVLADIYCYLRVNKEGEEILHPKEISTRIRKFSRMNMLKQRKILYENFNVYMPNTVNKSKAELTKIYRKMLQSPKYTYKV